MNVDQIRAAALSEFDLRPLICSEPCPHCGAKPGIVCREPRGVIHDPPHVKRYTRWARAQLAREQGA